MPRALVTGASGFVGQYLVAELERHGTEVICMTSKKWKDAGDKWHEVDVRDGDTVSSLVRNTRPDEIYHLAALSTPTGNDYREYFDVNLYGTLNVLNAAQDVGSGVLVVGSAYAYGIYNTKIDEDCPLNPVNVYGASKAAQDALAGSYSYTNRVIRVRPFNHTGAGQGVSFLVPGLISRMIAAERTGDLISIGNTSSIRDFLDVRDVVNAYRLIMLETEEPDVYNLCSGTGYSVQQVFDEVSNCLESEISYESSEDLVRATDIKMLVGDSRKLEKNTSWKPKISFRETIESIVREQTLENGIGK